MMPHHRIPKIMYHHKIIRYYEFRYQYNVTIAHHIATP